MKKIAKRYFEIKQEISKLTKELKGIEPLLFNDIAMTEEETIVTDYAIFKTTYRPKWQYSDELKEQESLYKEKFKVLKKQEELTGKAKKLSSGGFIRMSPVKEA